MPLFIDSVQSKEFSQLRVLAYGPSLTRKTWWAAKAAEAGFNVLLLDGDGNPQVLNNLPPEAQRRIRHIRCRDGVQEVKFSLLLTALLGGHHTVWDDTANRMAFSAKDKTHDHFVLNVRKLTSNDVLVLDSWTAAQDSAMLYYAQQNDINLADAQKAERESYNWQGNLNRFWLMALKALPCHVIVVGHSTIYEKRKKVLGKEEVEWVRTQPVSSSGPNAMAMSKSFSEVLFFSIDNLGKVQVDGTSKNDRDGGSRVLAVKRPWEDLQFVDFIKASNNPMPQPDAEMPGCIFVPAGEEIPGPSGQTGPLVSAQTAKATTLQVKPSVLPAQQQAKPAGMSLMGLATKR